ncbi:DNA replication factor CDT1 like protein [Cryptosporidium felis]|nr:DNA replication factor CDT1 like protein [Cryptosporidium felis]
MVRRSKRIQLSSHGNDNLQQSRLDTEFGIKSSVLINDLSKKNHLKNKYMGIKTRSMAKIDIIDKKKADEFNTHHGNNDGVFFEDEIVSPKKKSKTRQKYAKKNTLCNQNPEESYGGGNSLNSDREIKSKVIKGDLKTFKAKDLKEYDEEASSNCKISQLDSLLPPTAPESQVSSPLRDDEENPAFFVGGSFSNDTIEARVKENFEDVLLKECNTNISIYSYLFKPSNRHHLERLKKIKLAEKYEHLIELFQGLEIVLRLLERRQKPFFYPSFVKEQVENISKKSFSLDNLLRIVWISPQLISVRWCSTNNAMFDNFGSPNKKTNEYFDKYELEIVLNNGINNPINRLSHSNINERVDIFRLIMIDFMLLQQNNYLNQKLTKNVEVNTEIQELRSWSTFFNIDSCIEVPKAKLPPKVNNSNNLISNKKFSSELRLNRSLTPCTRNLYNLKLTNHLSNVGEEIERDEGIGRRSISADNKTKGEVKDNYKTPTRGKKFIQQTEKDDYSNERYQLNTEPHLSSKNSFTTPNRGVRSSYLLSRSISPAITLKGSIPINHQKMYKSGTILSTNKDLLTPSQKDLLKSVKRREKIKEISAMINVEEDDYNNKLEQVKNELWVIQQLSFVFLRSKKIIPTTQLPLLAKRLTTYARNSPEVDKVQDSIVRLSLKWPKCIELGDSTLEKGTKLVKLHINDERLSGIIKSLIQERDLLYNQRDEFRLKTISKYQ